MYFNYNKIARGRLNEQIINDYFNDINHDLMEQYSTLDQITEDTNILTKISTNSINVSNKLFNIIDDFIEQIDTATGASIYTNTLYDSANIFIPSDVDVTMRGTILSDYGIGTCGISSSNRVLTGVASDGLILSSTASKHLTRIIANNAFDTRADNVYENDILNVIDPRADLPYLLLVKTTNNNINEAGLIVNLDDINYPANTIKIKPVPILEQTIRSLVINTNAGSMPFALPNGDLIQFPINNANNIMTTFGETTINSLSLNIVNTNKTATIPYEFIVGLAELSVEYNEYYNKSYIGFRFVTPKNTSNEYKKISQISFDWTYSENNTIAYVYKGEVAANGVTNSYLDMITSNGKTYTTPLTIDDDYVFIVVELNKFPNGASPMLKSCTVKFI